MTDENREFNYIHETITRLETDIEKLEDKVDNLEREISRYRGIVGGILFVVTAIGTFLKFFWPLTETN